jgi:hypothetical protein
MTKGKVPFRRPSGDEQTVLRQMQVKLLVRPKDIKACDQILVEHHYLHSAQLVGEQLRYAVVWKGRWLAVAAWSAPALHLKARDAFIGWSEAQRRERLPLVVNNSRLYQARHARRLSGLAECLAPSGRVGGEFCGP